MADVITRFKLETTQFDSKLRDASKGLSEFTRQAKDGGSSFTNFSQKAVESARSLGTIASGATNAKDKLKDLVGAYNDAAKAYNKLSQEQQQSDFGKALANSISQLKDRITEAKNEIYGLGNAMDSVGKGGGLFGGGKMSGMLQVFGGNLMTKGFELATGAAMSFVNTIKDAVGQGLEMAKAGEGIRLAFERLNRPDILDELRAATHGTVTDLELMKQAVKFNDFNLSLDEMGTLLAFAQQKAKDTGQSVDYMVDSIVTGLGRQSLMILDNLGLSASEIKERMKETGDMTKAVADIIRDQMANAGDYVETAADRAARADAELKNAMEELGRTLMPLEEQGTSMWKSLETGAVNLLNDGINPLVPAILELKNTMADLYDTVANNSVLDGFLDWLKAGYDWTIRFIPVLNNLKNLMDSAASRPVGIEMDFSKEAAGKANLEALMAAEIAKKSGRTTSTVIPRRRSGGGGRSTTTTTIAPIIPAGSIADLNSELSKLRKNQELATNTTAWDEWQAKIDKLTTKIKILKGEIPDPNKIQAGGVSAVGVGWGQDKYDSAMKQSEALRNKDQGFKIPGKLELKNANELAKAGNDTTKAWQSAASAVSSVGSALSSIDDPAAKVMGTIAQAIASVALAAAQAVAAKDTTASGWAWIGAAAAITATMVTMISQIHSATGYAEGGIVGGNAFSGDNIPIMANAGEVVLTKAMTANLASALQENGGGVRVSGEIHGETIVLAANRYLRRSGRGELVTWK